MIRRLAILPASVLLLAAGSPRAEPVRPLFQHDLPDRRGQALTVVEVDLAPGATAAPHRHGQAFVFAYVLSGSVTSQLGGGEARTYRAGERWFEPPGAHHVLTRNPSATAPARLLVTFVADRGAALKTDDSTPEPIKPKGSLP